jgi:hypothetical protein
VAQRVYLRNNGEQTTIIKVFIVAAIKPESGNPPFWLAQNTEYKKDH